VVEVLVTQFEALDRRFAGPGLLYEGKKMKIETLETGTLPFDYARCQNKTCVARNVCARYRDKRRCGERTSFIAPLENARCEYFIPSTYLSEWPLEHKRQLKAEDGSLVWVQCVASTACSSLGDKELCIYKYVIVGDAVHFACYAQSREDNTEVAFVQCPPPRPGNLLWDGNDRYVAVTKSTVEECVDCEYAAKCAYSPSDSDSPCGDSVVFLRQVAASQPPAAEEKQNVVTIGFYENGRISYMGAVTYPLDVIDPHEWINEMYEEWMNSEGEPEDAMTLADWLIDNKGCQPAKEASIAIIEAL